MILTHKYEMNTQAYRKMVEEMEGWHVCPDVYFPNQNWKKGHNDY